MAYQTIAHLAWRFRMWYENKRLLAALAAPPLREISNQLKDTAQLELGEKRPFVIYSCHDIVSKDIAMAPCSTSERTDDSL